MHYAPTQTFFRLRLRQHYYYISRSAEIPRAPVKATPVPRLLIYFYLQFYASHSTFLSIHISQFYHTQSIERPGVPDAVTLQDIVMNKVVIETFKSKEKATQPYVMFYKQHITYNTYNF